MPRLVDIPGVELARTGTYRLSTGETTFTVDDFKAAIDARSSCQAVGRPILKQGHIDPRYDGQPALGWVDFETVTDDGALLGTYRGIPEQLAAQQDDGHSVLASAYPTRSIEGFRNYRCAQGHTHPFVITGVALLGATKPGVSTLQDLPALYGIAAAEEPLGEPFGDVPLRQPVRVVTGDEAAAIAAAQTTAGPGGESDHRKDDRMPSIAELLGSKVGLPADATDEQVAEAVSKALDAKNTAGDKPVDEKPAVDVDALVAAAVEKAVAPFAAALETTSGELAAIKAKAAGDEKTQFFAAAVGSGRIAPAERQALEDAWDENPALVRRLIEAKAPGSAVPVRASGYAGEADDPQFTDSDEAFLKGIGA